ncbi:MAG: hypothetical protein AB7P17_07630 [Nitrospirales bacterium]|nr:hypothetical protein [Nitrospirales bacterium]
MKLFHLCTASLFITFMASWAYGEEKMVVSANNIEIQLVDKDCWVDLFVESKLDVDHSHIRMLGPLQSPTLENVAGQNWNNNIQSLMVGPNARLYAYKNRDFSGPEVVFAPAQQVSELGELDMANDFESLKVQCEKE